MHVVINTFLVTAYLTETTQRPHDCHVQNSESLSACFLLVSAAYMSTIVALTASGMWPTQGRGNSKLH